MSTPDATLLSAYGNEDVYQAKLAGAPSVLGRIAMGLLMSRKMRQDSEEFRLQRQQAHLMNLQLRAMELERINGNVQNLRYTRAPVMVAPYMPSAGVNQGPMMADSIGYGSDIPVGLDAGMVRLASIAKEAGAALAKHAGISRAVGTVTRPLVAKLPTSVQVGAGAAALGAGYLGMKAIDKLGPAMAVEPELANFNQGGFQVPYGTNQYGHPQLGTPFI